MMKVRYELDDISWSGIKKIEAALQKVDGVEKVNVVSPSNKVVANFNENMITDEEVQSCLNKLGYSVIDNGK